MSEVPGMPGGEDEEDVGEFREVMMEATRQIADHANARFVAGKAIEIMRREKLSRDEAITKVLIVFHAALTRVLDTADLDPTADSGEEPLDGPAL